MKKLIALVIVSSMVMTSCSVYTCPTYAKKAPVKPANENRVRI